jgi:Putative auto-transporter adhesin, head GIN domain
MCRTSITRWPENCARAALLVALTALAACSGEHGQTLTEQRGVDAFHSVDLRGAADVSVTVGPATSVSLTAGAETLKGIETRVQNGVLIIDNEPGWRWFSRTGKLEVRIETPLLNALAVNGAGNVTITGVRGTALALALQGAGNLTAAGQTAALNARINGAGNMDLSQLVAGDASIAVNGAGSLAANVTGSLQATVNGVGSITYSGNPQKVEPQINGVGSIAPATPSGG